MRRHTIAPAAMLLAAICACAPGQVSWDEPTDLPAQLASSADVAFDAQRRLMASPPPTVALPVFIGQCAGSVRVARDSLQDWYAVWWSIRADSTADLMVSRSTDAVTWSPAVRVDSTDAGRVGCQRQPPSIAADGGNVHVAYAMAAREGPGIFASHSMDRGQMFHSPVAIVYGDRPGLTAIAARGNLVAVAYEDPNTNPPRIGLAISRSMAHGFAWRGLVSPASTSARAPSVALADPEAGGGSAGRGAGSIAVTWSRGSENDKSAPRQLRMGEIR